jgi:uncharacterized protein
MKKLLALALAALVASATMSAADDVPLFNATLTMGKEHRFVLASPSAGKTSSFLRIGETFEGYALKAYDAKTGELSLEHDGKVVKRTLVSDAATTNAPAIAATAADALRLLDAMNFEEMMDRMLVGMKKQQGAAIQQMMGQMGKAGPERDAVVAFQKKVLDEMMSALNGAEMKADVAKAYSEVFTKDELQGLAGFYSTPLGQVFSEKQPLLQEKMSEVMMPRMMAFMPKMQQMQREFATEMRAKRDAAKAAAAAAPAPEAPPAPANNP